MFHEKMHTGFHFKYFLLVIIVKHVYTKKCWVVSNQNIDKPKCWVKNVIKKCTVESYIFNPAFGFIHNKFGVFIYSFMFHENAYRFSFYTFYNIIIVKHVYTKKCWVVLTQI